MVKIRPVCALAVDPASNAHDGAHRCAARGAPRDTPSRAARRRDSGIPPVVGDRRGVVRRSALSPAARGGRLARHTTQRAAGEVAIVAGDPLVGEWRRALEVTADLLAGGAERVVLLWVGAVAVLSGLDALVGQRPHPMTLVVRAVEGLPDDGLAPTESDLIADGLYSTSVAVFGAGARPGRGVVVGTSRRRRRRRRPAVESCATVRRRRVSRRIDRRRTMAMGLHATPHCSTSAATTPALHGHSIPVSPRRCASTC